MERHIRIEDKTRWERYHLRRQSGERVYDSPNDPEAGDDEDREENPGVLARDSLGGSSGSGLQVSGEAPADEHGFPMISQLVSQLSNIDVVEAYSPPRVTEEAKKFGLKAGEAWDLTNGWDFTRKDHQEQAEAYLDKEKPLVLIGSPPCTPFSQLQSLNPVTERSKQK